MMSSKLSWLSTSDFCGELGASSLWSAILKAGGALGDGRSIVSADGSVELIEQDDCASTFVVMSDSSPILVSMERHCSTVGRTLIASR